MSAARLSIIPSRAVSDPNLSASQFRTLAALGTYGDKNGWCYPSLKTLGKALNKSPQAVSRDIQHLKALGYLNVTARGTEEHGRLSNLYQIRLDYPLQLGVDTPSTSEVDTPSTSEVEQTTHINDSINEKRKERAPVGAPPPPPTDQKLMFQAVADVTLMDAKLNAGRIGKAAAALVKAGYTPGQVTALYARGGSWYSRDWRGQRGDPPSPEQIGQTIRAMMDPEYQDAPARTNGHRETTFERNMRALAEIMSEQEVER